MQRVLEKMADQLLNYDEASLMQLWQHYAAQVLEFEPTRRWEESAIALCLIQAVRWKNQLFNYHMVLSVQPPEADSMPPIPNFLLRKREKEAEQKQAPRRKATLLRFPGHEADGGDAGRAKPVSAKSEKSKPGANSGPPSSRPGPEDDPGASGS